MGEAHPGSKSFLGGGPVSGDPRVRRSERRAIIRHDEGAGYFCKGLLPEETGRAVTPNTSSLLVQGDRWVEFGKPSIY